MNRGWGAKSTAAVTQVHYLSGVFGWPVEQRLTG